MNQSKKGAEIVLAAQKLNEAQELAEQSNRHSYNWNSLVKLLSYLDEPQHIAESLLFTYFELTALLADKGQDYGIEQDRLSAGLYYLRAVYEAIQDMMDKDKALVQITPITDLR